MSHPRTAFVLLAFVAVQLVSGGKLIHWHQDHHTGDAHAHIALDLLGHGHSHGTEARHIHSHCPCSHHGHSHGDANNKADDDGQTLKSFSDHCRTSLTTLALANAPPQVPQALFETPYTMPCSIEFDVAEFSDGILIARHDFPLAYAKPPPIGALGCVKTTQLLL